MGSRKELHVLLRCVEELRVPGRSDDHFDVYCLLSCGHQQHRSRLIEHTAAPDWNEEFVFDGSDISRDDVIKIEVFNQGTFQDELLFYSYLELHYCANLDDITQPEQQQQQQPGSDRLGFKPNQQRRRFRPSTGDISEEEEEGSVAGASSSSSQAGDAAAAANGVSPRVTGSFSSGSSQTQNGAAPLAAVAGGTANADAAGRMSDITTERLALLCASKLSGSSSGSGRLRSTASELSSRALSGRSSKGLSKLRLKRSTHVRSATDLVVSVWWVLQPALVDSGVPPCVLSFVHRPGFPHSLPSATHTDEASLWEEPCLAFVRLVVSTVKLGPAAAAIGCSTASDDGGGGVAGSKGSVAGRMGSKAVLRRMAGLLQGDAAAKEEVEAATATAAASAAHLAPSEEDRRSRISFRDIHGAGNLAQSFRTESGPGLGMARFDCQVLDYDDDDDDRSDVLTLDGSTAGSSSSMSHWMRRSSSGGSSSNGDHKQQPGGKSRSSNSGSSSSKDDKQLYLSVKVQLGDQEPQALQRVPLKPDGSADVNQAAVFAVVRPLEEADISYHIGLGRGPRGTPLVTVVFQYKLLHLLRRSPPHPQVWEDWRAVARCTVSGLQVPMPDMLPMAYLDLSAFLADADCRAGMYQVPAVSAAALKKAADDDAAAAAALTKQALDAAAKAIEASAAADSDASLTDSEDLHDESQPDITYDYVMTGGGSEQRNSSGGGAGPGVLRRRPVPGSAEAEAEEAAAAAAARASGQVAKKHRKPHLDKWRSRMLSGVEAGLNQAMDKLPDKVAEQVKGRLINRIFPRAQRAQVFSLGQLRVLSTRDGTAPGTTSQLQQQQQQLSHSPAGGGSPPHSFSTQQQQQQQQMIHSVSSGLLSAKTKAEQAAAEAAAAAAAAKRAAYVVPLQDHPNVATSGSPAAGPLGVLQLTLQAINLRKGSLSAGYSLLLKSGPHWLEVCPSALPITIYSSTGDGSGSRGETNKAPPLQILLPVYGSSCLVALVLHRRSSVVGRCVFRLYGLLPLLLRDYNKSLVLYSDKRGQGGGRIIAGSVLLKLSAMPAPGSSRLGTYLRLAFSYLITPHTLSLHTSGVLETLGRDQRAVAAGRVVSEWLADQGQAVVPDSLVNQLVSTGRTALSTRSMKGHVRRIKAVLLDWLPRRLDPLAFYYWKRPLHNILALWVLSHACLYPGHWLLSMALLVTAVLLWHIVIQIRHGVLGFEMEQLLPPELGASLADLQAQGDSDGASEVDSVVSGSELGSQLRSVGQLADRAHFKEAADRIRDKIAAGRHKLQAYSQGEEQQKQAAAPKLPTSLAELREQLEAGTLSLDALDLEAAAQQLFSVGGLLKLARKHSTYVLEYALVAQNLLDDAAGFAEGLYAMATAQDPLATLVLCMVLLGAASFCYVAGLGAGVWVLVAVLLRPPIMRSVPGLVGWKAILAHLRGHGRSLEELAW